MRSNPATGGRDVRLRARSSASMRVTSSARSGPVTASEIADTRSAIRRWRDGWVRFGVRPNGSPLIGSAHSPSMRKRCSSLTCEPASTPLPPSRPASPAPRKMPGGVPDSA